MLKKIRKLESKVWNKFIDNSDKFYICLLAFFGFYIFYRLVSIVMSIKLIYTTYKIKKKENIKIKFSLTQKKTIIKTIIKTIVVIFLYYLLGIKFIFLIFIVNTTYFIYLTVYNIVVKKESLKNQSLQTRFLIATFVCEWRESYIQIYKKIKNSK